jgi:DNA-binding MarR family transcriptional regulator
MSSEDFGVLLNLAFGAFKDSLHEAMARDGFADLGATFGYVFRLLDEKPRNLRDVAEQLAITPQGALKIIDEMVAKGYVERREHPEDGRIRLLALTNRGQLAIASARRHHKRFEKALAAHIGKENVIAARLALEAIVGDAKPQAGGLPRPA